MGLFGKSKGKSYSFDYTVQVHSLRPWPASAGPLSISWQRGSSKRGSTAPVNPTTTPGNTTAEYRFEDRLNISATLYSVRSNSCAYQSVPQPKFSSSCQHHYLACLPKLSTGIEEQKRH